MKNFFRIFIILLCLAGLSACSDSSGNGKNSDASIHEDAGTDAETSDTLDAENTLPDSTRDPEGPEILDFSVSPSRLTDSNVIHISVSITHPNGFADIGGGKIIDEDGEVYATFIGSGGTYSAALNWISVQNVSRIDFAASQSRVFIAEFFDAANHRTRHTFEIELHCDGEAACNGVCGFTECTDACGEFACDADHCIAQQVLADDALNCGACGNACGQFDICQNFECVCEPNAEICDGACADLQRDPQNCGGCGTSCATGEVCYVGECIAPTYSGAACDQNSDCPGGECVDFLGVTTVCALACQSATDCGSGYICEDNPFLPASAESEKSCFRPCNSTSDCGPGDACVNPFEMLGTGPNQKICANVPI